MGIPSISEFEIIRTEQEKNPAGVPGIGKPVKILAAAYQGCRCQEKEKPMFLKKSRDRIIQEFDRFCRALPGPSEKIQKDLLSMDEDTALALKFLYANMPCSDVGNYSLETYLDYARQGVSLWKNSPYRAAIPENIFLNHVLYHRVNEEEIKPCRSLFAEKNRKADCRNGYGERYSGGKLLVRRGSVLSVHR